MIIDLSRMRIFVRPGPTDMRKATNGLNMIVEQQMALDPFGANLFLFCNAERRLLKALYWDRNGFCLWQKRLERDRFPWPATVEETREISSEQCAMLLSGIDFWKAHQALHFNKVS